MAKNADSLPAKLVRRLGRESDRSLAAEFGVSVFVLGRERKRRGIPTHHRVSWTPQKIAVLGKMPDNQAAKRLGVTTNSVFAKRTALGIPPFGKNRSDARFEWNSKATRRLGVVSDAVLAKELGVSGSVVTAKRHSLGIAPSRGIEKTRKPWTKAELAMLGKLPDTEVARKTGRGRRHIRAKRESLGLPAFQQQKSVEWTSKIVARMGKVSNAELAKELGVSEGSVALHRRRLQGKSRARATKASGKN